MVWKFIPLSSALVKVRINSSPVNCLLTMSREFQDNERAMIAVQRRLEGNTYCADCSGDAPEYVNLTVGTFICKDCADVHRSISNRRIKDIYGRDLTPEDVRRMADVGNDKANRRFLATWDPVEFPEPDTTDKDRLQNFIWLKYEGSWKKAPAPPSYTQRYERDARDNRFERERELFQDVSHQRREQQQSSRSIWAERLGRRPQQTQPPRHDDYRQYDGGVERFAREPPVNRDRFRAPAPTGYGRRMDGGPPPQIAHPRHREEYDEEYDRRGDRRRDSGRSGRRDSGRSDYRISGRTEPHRRRDETGRRKKTNRYASEEDDEDFNEVVVDKRRHRKTTKPRREVVQDSEEESSDEDYASRSKKIEKKKKKKTRSKTSKKKRRDESESDSDDGVEDEDDVDSLPSTTADSVHKGKTVATRATPPSKAEFDLMSDWMGAETETNTTAPSSTSAVTQAPPTTQAGMMQMPPQPAVQMPMVAAPPMSMYGTMMPNPHAAYMTGMPYYMTSGVPMGMGMNGMPMMPPPHPQMGMPGLMNGMASMNLAGGQQQPGQAQPPAPPPPPPQMQYSGPVPPPPQGPPPS